MEEMINKTPNISIICAPPESGKTYLIKYLLNEMFKNKKVKYGIVFCPTKFKGQYNYLPNEFIHAQYNENVLRKFYNIQIAQFLKNKNIEPAFVIFDDCIGSISFKSSFMKKIISTFRHPNITFFFATQYIMEIPPLIRQCASYFITFDQRIELSFNAIQKNYMPDKTIEEVEEFIEENTEDYHFILVKLNAKKKEQRYFIEKVPEKYKEIKIKY